jgi:carbon storage regulator
MLVLTRKTNQAIIIGDEVEITILSVVGDKVRIGIQAPREIPVFRKEIYVELDQAQAIDSAVRRSEQHYVSSRAA